MWLFLMLLSLSAAPVYMDDSCYTNGMVDCPTNARMSVLENKLDLVRLQFRGLLSECDRQDPYELIECEAPVVIEGFSVAVTGEGGDQSTSPPESKDQNSTTSLFQINGERVLNTGDWPRGLTMAVADRVTMTVSDIRTFDIWLETSSPQDVLDYVRAIPEDSIILVSAIDRVATANKEEKLYTDRAYFPLWLALNSIGLYKRFKTHDSFAGIGFKASPGVCDRVPEWVANAHADDPGREGRAEWTPPVTAHALIPTNCEPYTQNADFTVTLVSEGDSRGREYEVDGEQSQSLFMVNEKRVFGAPWYRGINVVNLDPALRTVIAADTFDTHVSKDEGDRFASFIEDQAEGSLLLITVYDDGAKKCKANCLNTLRALGYDFNAFHNNVWRLRDALSLITMKGTCQGETEKPSWKTQGFKRYPFNGRGDLFGEPIFTTATIPYQLCG